MAVMMKRVDKNCDIKVQNVYLGWPLVYLKID